MRPLATTQLMMAQLSMCSAVESTTCRQRNSYSYTAYTSAILVFNAIGFVASFAYCAKFFSIDFNGSLFGLMVVIGEFGLIYFLIAAISMRRQIDGIFASLSTIYKNRKYSAVNRSLQRKQLTK